MTTIAHFASGASAFTPVAPRPVEQAAVSVRSDEPVRSWTDVIDQLLSLRVLEDDWDGQGAEAPEPSVVDSALKLALRFRSTGMSPADRIVAGVNGTVFFEWFAPSQYLEIEVLAPGQVEGRWVYTDSNAVEEFTLLD